MANLADPPSDPHEYHEISDEDVGESPGFDMGPSLMDEVLRALGGNGGPGSSNSPRLDKNFDWKDEPTHAQSECSICLL